MQKSATEMKPLAEIRRRGPRKWSKSPSQLPGDRMPVEEARAVRAPLTRRRA